MESVWDNENLLKITGNIFNKERKSEALCNEVYFLDCEKGKFIIKIACDKARQEELKKEYELICMLDYTKFVPKIELFFTVKNISCLLIQFIVGNKPTQFSDEILKIMASRLREIHGNNESQKQVDFDNLLNLAEKNMNEGRLDMDEFIINGKFVQPQDLLTYLKTHKPIAKECLLHGDFRPKNMIINNKDLYIIDWGLSFYGDPYYDLAIIKYYFTDIEFEKFCSYYGLKNIDNERLKYNEYLSSFLNV